MDSLVCFCRSCDAFSLGSDRGKEDLVVKQSACNSILWSLT